MSDRKNPFEVFSGKKPLGTAELSLGEFDLGQILGKDTNAGKSGLGVALLFEALKGMGGGHSPEDCVKCKDFAECENPLKDIAAQLFPQIERKKVADLTEADLIEIQKLYDMADEINDLQKSLQILNLRLEKDRDILWKRLQNIAKKHGIKEGTSLHLNLEEKWLEAEIKNK
jgi:hypothetical protein